MKKYLILSGMFLFLSAYGSVGGNLSTHVARQVALAQVRAREARARHAREARELDLTLLGDITMMISTSYPIFQSTIIEANNMLTSTEVLAEPVMEALQQIRVAMQKVTKAHVNVANLLPAISMIAGQVSRQEDVDMLASKDMTEIEVLMETLMVAGKNLLASVKEAKK